MRIDPDYRENQARAQTGWRERNPDYWQAYRQARVDYADRNRQLQRTRNRRREAIAKMDASPTAPPLLSGLYTLRAEDCGVLAKMVVWTVRLTVLSATQESGRPIAKI